SVMINEVRERTSPMFLNILIVNILVFKVWSNIPNTSLKVFCIAYSITYFILFCSALLKRKYSAHVAGGSTTIPLVVNRTTAYYLNRFTIVPLLFLFLRVLA